MAKLVGPLMSLSASGKFADTFRFWYGPYGPVCGSLKRYKHATTPAWEVNTVLFKNASNRWNTFNKVVRKAWFLFAYGKGDCGRDLFMGKQIEMWNLSLLNDITYPTAPYPVLPHVPGVKHDDQGWWPVEFYDKGEGVYILIIWDGYYSKSCRGAVVPWDWGYNKPGGIAYLNYHRPGTLIKDFYYSVAGIRWYRVLDTGRDPLETEKMPDTEKWSFATYSLSGHTHYWWYRFVRLNGDLTNLRLAYKYDY